MFYICGVINNFLLNSTMKKSFLGLLLCFGLSLTASAQSSLQKQVKVLKDSMELMRLSLDSVTQVERRTRQLLTEIKGREASSVSDIDSLNRLNAYLNEQLEQYQIQNDSMKTALNNLELKYQQMVLHADSMEQYYSTALAEYKKMEDRWKRRKYINIGYSSPSLDIEGLDGKVKSDYSISISRGRTYYLHKNPLFNMIKFGLDLGFLDVNMAQYNPIGEDSEGEDTGDFGEDSEWGGSYYPDDEEGDENIISGMLGDIIPDKLYKAEIGVHFGPSVTVNPIDYLMVNAYFRYVPSYSMKITKELDFAGSFASYFNLGIAVSYKMISVGLEKRWGTASFESEETDETGENVYSVKRKWTTSCPRFYISFRL